MLPINPTMKDLKGQTPNIITNEVRIKEVLNLVKNLKKVEGVTFGSIMCAVDLSCANGDALLLYDGFNFMNKDQVFEVDTTLVTLLFD